MIGLLESDSDRPWDRGGRLISAQVLEHGQHPAVGTGLLAALVPTSHQLRGRLSQIAISVRGSDMRYVLMFGGDPITRESLLPDQAEAAQEEVDRWWRNLRLGARFWRVLS